MTPPTVPSSAVPPPGLSLPGALSPGDSAALAARIAAVQDSLAAAAIAAGRDPATVKLLPVSKTHPAGVVAEAARLAGWKRFAENRPQELAAKAETLAGQGLDWVLIGPLQTNKAGLAARHAAQFQALDSLATAAVLDRRLQAAGRGMEVMIEVNTSGEAAKHGVAPADALALARGLAPYSALRPVGLMTVALDSRDEQAVRACFARLRTVQQQLRDDGAGNSAWPELSMGMSGDFAWAVAEGSTMVRIGTAIFGRRQ